MPLKRRRKKAAFITPHTLFLIAAFIIVIILFFRRKKMIAPLLLPDGWSHYTSVTNIYDIVSEGEQTGRVWFATAEGLVLYDKDHLSWRTFGPADGLLSASVSSVTDGGDCLWLSTWRGVNRLDKKSLVVTTLPLPATILNKRTFTVRAYGQGLWIGTDGRGLIRFDLGDSTVRTFTTDDGLASNHIYSIAADGDSLWCGGNEKTLSVGNVRDGTWRTLDPPFGNNVTRIFDIAVTDTAVWMATSNTGIWCYIKRTGAWHRYGKAAGFFSEQCYSLALDGSDIWAGTTLGVVRYDARTGSWIALVPPEERRTFTVSAICADNDYIWYGTFGKGLGKYFKNRVKWVYYSGGLTRDHVKALAVQDENLWAGFGYQDGWADLIGKDDLVWKRNYNLWDGLTSANINAILVQDNAVFFGTWQGLFRYERGTDCWTAYSLKTGHGLNDVTCLTAGKDAVWAGTDRGMFRINPETGVPEPAGNRSLVRIKALCRGAADDLYTGCIDGTIWRYRHDTAVWKKLADPAPGRISALAWFGGRLWAGIDDQGVLVIDPATGRRETYRKVPDVFRGFKKGPGSDRISCLAVISGELWIGSDAGFQVVDRDGNWRPVTFTEGLLNDEVLTVTEGETYIWIGHNGGMTRIAKTEFLKHK